MKCAKCKIDKSESEFSWRNIANGLRQKVCRECKTQYNKDHYIHRKEYYNEKRKRNSKKNRNWLNEYKLDKECVKCGNNHPAVLDFHHRDSDTKEFAISNMTIRGFGKQRVLSEIDKCDILCSNCHRVYHWEEKFNAG